REASRAVREHRGRSFALGEPPPVEVEDERDVEETGRLRAEGAVEGDLPRGRIEEIRTSDDLGDRHVEVVDHDGEVIGDDPVGPADHEIAVDAARRDVAEERVAEAGRGLVEPEAERVTSAPIDDAGAAEVRIAEPAVARGTGRERLDLAPRARARIDVTFVLEARDRRLVELAAIALEDRPLVVLEPEPLVGAEE